jgi:hypothetical protein
MKLMMLFGNEIIDLIKINKAKLSTTQLLNLQQKLISRNEESLNLATDVPQFALHTPSARGKQGNEFILI